MNVAVIPEAKRGYYEKDILDAVEVTMVAISVTKEKLNVPEEQQSFSLLR
jgi:hypothetical protein